MGGLHVLGVRHHGPGSARSVLRALDRLRPDVVLVEAPADTTAALRWIGDDGLVPPVALLGWVVDHPARAAFAPLARFSPEWQAVAWANERGVEVRAIDLPLSATLAVGSGADAEPDELLGEDAAVDPLAELARAAGEPDVERWWEDVIEHRGDGEPAFEAVATAMSAVRQGTFTAAGEARREAHMRRAIRGALREGATTAVVVCGAWHVPALDPAHGLERFTVSGDAAALRGLPKVKVGVAWVPWTHRRLTSRSGYAAGVDSPGWYAHVFTNPGVDGVARFFVDTARLLRSSGVNASPDHLIAGSRLAEALAALRDRPRPGLAEVLDSADAVMGGVDIVRDQLVVGDALGAVPASAPQVPLARDVAAAQRSARLRPEAGRRTLELDLRTPAGRRRSRLLHRLRALDVTWGRPVEGRGSSGTFRETWELDWEPEASVTVVERSAYGTTLERAAAEYLLERSSTATRLAELVQVLDLALLADLPAVVEPVVAELARRAATDPDVVHLIDALPPLATAVRYGDVRDTDTGALERVLDGLVVRVLAGLPAACRSLDADAAAAMVVRLGDLQAGLAMVDHPARRVELPGVLARLTEPPAHGLVQGRATRLLHDAGSWTPDSVERRLARALSPGRAPATGAAFVEGFLAGAGTVLVHDRDLLRVLDRWLCSLPPDAFDMVVALLRRTFGSFEPAERRQIMALLTDHDLDPVAGFGDAVDARRADEVLVTVRHLLGVPVSGPATRSSIEGGEVDG